MIVYLYNNDLKNYLNSKEEIYFINIKNETSQHNCRIIPFINNYPSLELSCLESVFLYFEKTSNENEYVNVKLKNINARTGMLQLLCINSFKKRRLINKKINLDIDLEDFNIKIKNIPELICLFNFFKKIDLINVNEYFFGFLINYYFSTIEKR